MARNNIDNIVLVETFGTRSAQRQKNEAFDGERNLSIDCHDLRYLRRYLMLVGQWYPEEWSQTKKNLYHIWQVLVTIGVWLYLAYSFGCFGAMTIEQQHMRWFPISSIEDIVWESRWVISHHLGLFYFCRCRHMETFLKESCLNQGLWRETSRYLKRICQVLIVFLIFLPICLHPAEIFYSVQPEDAWKVALDTLVLALDRLLSVPIFLVFVLVAYVLVRVVKGYGECIKSWPKNYKNVEGSGMRAAKSRFLEIKNLISSVEKAFQLYLSLHFLSLLLTAFLGIFACVEQLEANHTYFVAGTSKYYVSRIKIQPAAVISPATKVKQARLMKEGVRAVLPGEELNGEKSNVTLGKVMPVLGHAKAEEKQMFVEVGIEAVLKILESIVLYLVPLTLMLRLQTKLRLVRQAIVDSDCFEQQENDFLFQDEKSIKTMDKYVATCSGITIFGYKMPLFRAFLLAVFAPFLTAVTTFLFSYIHVKRK